MSLVVEDGTVIANAESYAAVATADTYWSNRSTNELSSEWSAATTAQKESALRSATQYLDAIYNWKGEISDDDQELGWPRVNVFNERGTELTDVVPASVVNATIEYAARALSTQLFPDQDRGGAVIREKIGPLETEYANGAPPGTTYPFIDAMLRGLITSGSGGSSSVDVIRA